MGGGVGVGGGQWGGRWGWAVRWALGVGGKPKAGNTIHSETNSSIVSSVEHRNCHSQLEDSHCQQFGTSCSPISAPQ